MSVDSLLRQGMEAITKGERGAALECFAQVLRQDPRHPVALINRGGLLVAAGQLEEALGCFLEVPEGHPLHVDALSNAGYVLRRMGRTAEALGALDQALALKPRHAVALANRGLTLSVQGQWKEAVVALRAAVTEAPSHLDALSGLARALAQLGRWEEAMEVTDRALALQPRHLNTLNVRAYLLMMQERHEEALSPLGVILGIDPANLEALTNRGCSLLALNRVEEALATLERALALDPRNLGALENYGAALLRAKRFEEALACVERALAIDPGHPGALHHRADALAQLHRFQEALETLDRPGAGVQQVRSLRLKGQILLELSHFAQALSCFDGALAQTPEDGELPLLRAICLEGLMQLEEAGAVLDSARMSTPATAESCQLRGVLLDRLGRRQEALEALEQAVRLDPRSAEARYDRSLVLLALGRLEEGFREMEARWLVARPPVARHPSSAPVWLGDQPVQGKTLLVDAEQGFGDTLQFARYIPGLQRRGATVIFRAHKSLAGVLSTLDKDLLVVSDARPAPPHDLRCPVMSLPHAFGTTLESIPAPIPYLHADPAAVAAWEERLGPKRRPRIGLVWAGRQHWPVNHRRDMTLAQLSPLLALPADFISLQKEVPQADRGALHTAGMAPFGEGLADFADTAALLQCIDLLIAVDTSVVHLAGALGRPVWVLNRYAACWRWLEGRADSPWYPTARLFRQRTAGDWHLVVEEVTAELGGWLRREG